MAWDEMRAGGPFLAVAVSCTCLETRARSIESEQRPTNFSTQVSGMGEASSAAPLLPAVAPGRNYLLLR